MKITKTLVVAGLLVLGSTAAHAGYHYSGGPSFAGYDSKFKSSKDDFFKKVSKGPDFGKFDRKDRDKRPKYSDSCMSKKKMKKCGPGGPGPKDPKVDPVPLPAGGLLLLGGLGVLALQRRRKA